MPVIKEIHTDDLIELADIFYRRELTIAEFEKWLKDFHPADIVRWVNAGFSYEEAKEWADYDFEPEQAEEWAREGFDPFSASEWRSEDVETPEEARIWDKVIGTAEPKFVRDWIREGFTAKEALKWSEYFTDPFEASAWSRYFDNPEEADEWSRYFDDPREARELLNAVEDFSEPGWKKAEILKILVGPPTKWEDFVDKEMWGVEVGGYEEDLMWVSRSGQVGVMRLGGREVWKNVIPYELRRLIYEFPRGEAFLVVFDGTLYKLKDFGDVYWVMEREKGDMFVGDRGYGSF
jgi:hypothetical protein